MNDKEKIERLEYALDWLLDELAFHEVLPRCRVDFVIKYLSGEGDHDDE